MPVRKPSSRTAVTAAVLLTLGAAHLADRIAYGAQMKALGLAPPQQIEVMP